MGTKIRKEEVHSELADNFAEFEYGEIDSHITAMMDARVAHLRHESSVKRYLGQPHDRSRIKRYI